MPSPHFFIRFCPCTIPVEDLGQNAIVEAVGPGGPTADVWFQCRYDQRYTVALGLMGGVTATGRTFTRVLPFHYPPSPNMFCTAINTIVGIKPWTDPVGWLNYRVARIHAHFSVPSWDAIAGPDPSGLAYTTTTIRTNAEVFSPPGGAYYFPDLAGAPVPEASVSAIRSRAEITMVRHLMPGVPLAQILTNQGLVNDEAITLANFTFPRGCLFFAGGSVEPQADPSTGNRTWDVTYTFLGNEGIEWNAFMAQDGEYHLINTEKDGSGDPVFDYLNFAEIFADSF